MNYGGSEKQYTDKPAWNDPLGPTSVSYDKKGRQTPTYTPTGAPEMRTGIFNELKTLSPTMGGISRNVSGRLEGASTDAGFTDAATEARKNIRGDYLAGSPQLDAAMTTMRRASDANAADQDARIKNQYARSGMQFSTANQQAQQSNRASAAAAAGNTEAQARLANYEAERQRQGQGTQQLAGALGTPLDFEQNAEQVLMNPLSQAGSLISGLSSGGPIATPSSTIVKQPGVGDYITGALSSY